MRILHTADWHIGRTFHHSSTHEHLRAVLEELPELVRKHKVDVVVVAGDIFDSFTPAGIAFDFLREILEQLRATGVKIILSSGNHDSAARLRFPALWSPLGGIHISADPLNPVHPVALSDEYGTVWFYPVPYIEPSVVRHLPDAQHVRRQEDAVGWALAKVRKDFATRAQPGDRTVVLAHCFSAGVPENVAEDNIERDLTAGGIDVVPASIFEGFDYVALGHIHTRANITETVRYSGAPLYHSFQEEGRPRGVWLVDLDAQGYSGAQWLDLPIPRRVTRLRGELQALLNDPSYEAHKDDWVQVILTDSTRPVDAMRLLRSRFPYAVHLEWIPTTVERQRGRIPARRSVQERERISDEHRLTEFYDYLYKRAPDEQERHELTELLAAMRNEEAQQ